jgi:hypothetical protein
MLTPGMVNCALTTHQSRLRDISVDPEAGIAWDEVVIPNYHASIGITSLAIIAIGLFVTWAGYIKGVRWTWFVMFVIAWVWTFPVLILPFLRDWNPKGSTAQTLANAVHESGMARTFVGDVLAFLLMMLALILPAKTFILGRRRGPGTPAGAER